MKRLLETISFVLLSSLCLAQQYTFYHFPDKSEYDSARTALKYNTNDTALMVACHELFYQFAGSNRDSSYYFSKQELGLARKFGFKIWEADALDPIGFSVWRLGNYPEAYQSFLDGIKITEDPASEKTTWGLERFNANKDPRIARLTLQAGLRFDLSTLYEKVGDGEKEFAELSKGEKVATENNDTAALAMMNMQLGSYYLSRHMIDTAIVYSQRSVGFAELSGFRFFEGDALNNAGYAYLKKGDYVSAKKNFLRSLWVCNEQHNYTSLADTYVFLADLFIKQRNADSALYYAREGLPLIEISHDKSIAPVVYSSLSSVFETKNNMDSAFKYQGLALAARDSSYNAEKIKQFEDVGFTEQLRAQQLEEEKAALQNKVRAYAMLSGLGVALLFALVFYRNNRRKQQANVVLAKTLSDLKSTQSQLILSEKMASLGELTAGIAHEIQNPLNFVNNFSDVNKELLVEMKDEMKKGNLEEADSIANDVIENEQKINHHGKRADAIVKGMLQHSRKSSGQKEPTDINTLADEYLRLSYHGMRAKDKSFNAEMKTDFDKSLSADEAGIGKINIIPQDIGRVLLNLFNNAFYAASLPSPERIGTGAGGVKEHEPIVSVSTKKSENSVLIAVSDNGNGIPKNIVDKIFQPFFTTKPTGEGTGLGLSLAYDIIKAHGGELKVESKEGEGSEFIILLPLTKPS